MKSRKILAWLISIAIVLALIAGGVTFLFLRMLEHNQTRDLQVVRNFLDQKQYDEASKMIETLAERAKGNESWYPLLIGMRLELFEGLKDETKAKAAAESLLAAARGEESEPTLRARMFLGRLALQEHKFPEAAEHFTAIQKYSDTRAGSGADIAAYGLTRIQYDKEGASPEIHKKFEDLLEKYPTSEFRRDIEQALGEMNMEALLSQEPADGDQIYVIQKGDSIALIGKKFKVSEELLMRVNGIASANRLSPNRRIKIPNTDFSIVVNKSDNTLLLLNGGKFFKRYPVRTGKVDYLTPTGDFKIVSKVKNPKWSNPKTGKSFPPNDPENELGTRWMGFQGTNLGIHGTIKPETIGGYASNGCVGMLMSDVEELFDLVRTGVPIKITGKIDKSLKTVD